MRTGKGNKKIIVVNVCGSFSFRVATGIFVFAALLSTVQAAATGEVLVQGIGVNSLAFDPTGVFLAGARDDGRVTIWDWNDTAKGVVRELVSTSSGALTGLAFSPDGTMVVASSLDSVVRLWDVSSGRLMTELTGHGEAGAVLAAAFSPDGKTIATAGADTKVMLWDVASGRLKAVLTGHRGFVRSVAFGQKTNMNMLASGSDDGSINIWDADSGLELLSLGGNDGAVNTVAFSPDGRNLASGSRNGTVKEWNVSTGQLVRTYVSNGTSINTLAYSPDGTTLMYAGDGGSVKAQRCIDGALIGVAVHRAGIAVRAVAYSADSRTAASAGTDGVIKLWDASTWMEKGALTVSPKAPTGLTIFTTQTPNMYENDWTYELGTKFWADVNGQITQVRLHTNELEGGNHTVRIWRIKDATVLAGPYTWDISSGTAGWKIFTLPTPLEIAANTDYIVAISNSKDWWYAEQIHGFDAPIVNGNLHTYVSSGVYSDISGTMPTEIWENTNYFRDVVFVPQI